MDPKHGRSKVAVTSETRKLFILGPAGNLETVIGPPVSSDKKLIGIICHPHPLFEGTMNNKVVTTLAKAFQHLEIVPLRFNFRGVGKSQGEHGYSTGEIEDLNAVMAWVKQNYPDYRILLAGFSFGAYIAMKVATSIHPVALITIAPAVHHQDYTNLPTYEAPWLVVQGDADEVVPPNEVYDWIESLPKKPKLVKMSGVGHFFHGELIALREEIVTFLNSLQDE